MSLQTAAAIVLAAPTAMIVLWGPDNIQIYNDGYRAVMGVKHPGGLAQRNRDCWPEVWEFNAPIFDGVLQRGETFTFTDQRLVLERDGAPAEAFFTLAFSPVPDDTTAIGGILVTVFETTTQVRARDVREAALRASEAKYRALFDSLDTGFCIIEVLFDDAGKPNDYRFVETNPAFIQQTGLTNAIGRTIRELAPAHEEHWFQIYGRVVVSGEAIRFDAPAEALGRWYDVYAFRIGPPEDRQVAVLFSDVSTVKATGRERERLFAELQSANAELRRLNAEAR